MSFIERTHSMGKTNYSRTEHENNVRNMDDATFDRLRDVTAVGWRPGDGTDSFGGTGFLRDATKAVMFVLSYLISESGRRHLVFRGYKASASPDGGVVNFGKQSLFLFDGQLTPSNKGRGRTLNTDTNPSAFYTMMRMHKDARKTAVSGRYVTPADKLQMPRLLVAYTYKPELVQTEQLEQLGREYRGWGAEEQVPENLLLDAMQARWSMLLRAPKTHTNPTDYWLLDARAAHHPGARLFYDFSSMLGVTCFNPAEPLTHFKLSNPASACLQEIGINTRNLSDEQMMRLADDVLVNVSAEKMDSVLKRMRQALGNDAVHFCDEDLYAAMLAPRGPLVIKADNMEQQIATLGEARILHTMRMRLPQSLAAVVTDDELREAYNNLDKPLVVGGACRTQVVALGTAEGSMDGFDFTVGQTRFELWPDAVWGTPVESTPVQRSEEPAGMVVEPRQPANGLALMA